MKKINLIGMLQGCSKRNGTAVYASNPDGQPTVNRQSRLTSYPGEMNEKEQMSSTCPRFALVLPSFCSRLDSLSLVSRQSDLDQVRAVSVGFSARVWKHVAMIFAVLTLSMANVGMTWGADPVPASAGTYVVDGKKPGSENKFYKLGNGVYIHRRNNSSWTDGSGMKTTSTNTNGVAVYLSSAMNMSGLIKKASSKNEVTVQFDVYTLTNGATAFNTMVNGTDNSTTVSVTLSSSPTYTTSVTFAALGSNKAEEKSSPDLTLAAGYYYIVPHETTSVGKTFIYSITLSSAASCDANPANPGGLSVENITQGGATFTISDAANTNNYEIVCKTSSGAPAADATPTQTGTSKTIAVTGLSDGTTYYAFVRSVCDGSHKSSWVALGSSTFTTKSCSISECGNATLTYPIYTSGDLTTSNLFSGATSSNATAVSVGSSPAFTGVTVSAATKGSSANAGACYAKSTPLTGKMKYSASSKSSSYYIDIPFTVNTGYTFTPCDVQVVIQPVSSNQTFTVEITNGTNVYGTSTATLNAGVMEPIIGLTSPAEMSAGNYAIRLYPHGGDNKEFRMGANVILKGTTAAVASDAYDIHIGKNNADYTDESLTNTSGTTWSKTITLDAGSYYEFKVKKTPSAGDAVWYGNNGKITATTSPAWDFNTSDGNCKLYTSIAGSYTFSWDASTNKLTVTYPAGDHPTKRIYMACGSGTWCDASPKFFVHSWGVTDYNTQVQQNACGEYYADIIWYNDNFQFTRNNSTATAYDDQNWNYSQNLTYNSSQLLWTFSGWSGSTGNFSSSAYTPTTYTISYNAGTDGSGSKASESKTCGVDFTLPNSAVFTRTGYTQTGWTTSDGGAQTHALGGSYTTNAAQTFYPVWTPVQYDVTLEKGSAPAAGSSGSAKVYYDAAALTNISHATWAGHVLTGYYTSNSGGTKVLNADGSFAAANVSDYITDNKWTRAANTTLKAQWTCAALTLVLDGDAATPAGGSPIGTEYTLTCSASTGAIASYQWKQNTTASTTGAVNAEGTGATTASFNPVPAAAGTYYYYCVATDACDNSVNTSFSGAFTFTAPVVSYATSIDFEAIIDESGTGAAWKTTMEGRNYTLTQADGTKWSLDGGNSGAKPADKGLKIKETGDNAGKITFTVRANQTVELKVGTLAGTNGGTAKFSTDGGSSYSNITGAATASTGASVVTTYTGATDRTYVFKTNSASWNILQHIIIGYKITYDKGANGTGTIDPMYKTHGTNINLSSSTFTYAGHTQDGWSTSDGGSKVYELGASYTSDAPITLYPHWVEDVVVPTITATKTSPDYVTTDPNNLVLSISTTGASSGWYYRVKNTVTAGYQTPDNTSYNTATWTMTSGLVLGANNFVVELYNGSGVKQAESGTITVTAETAYPITIAAGAGGSVSPSGEIKANESGNHIHPAITATPNSGYHFVNWTYSNSNATVADASSASTTVNDARGACTITANFEADAPVATPMITWNLNVGTSAGTTLKSSTSTTDGTNITNIDIDQTNDGANGAGASDRTTKLALATGTTASEVAEPDKYEVFTFKVACGKKVTPSEVKIKVANVGSSAGGNQNYKAVLSDTYGHSISNTFTGTKSDGTVEEFSITNGGGTYFQGDVTLKLWSCKGASGNASAFRMGTPVEIYGAIGNQATPAATITWNTQPANGQVGDSDFAYDVTCSDGSAVTVTSANTSYATIVGGKLHYVAAGTTHLVATATDACGNVVVQNSNNFTVTVPVTYSITYHCNGAESGCPSNVAATTNLPSPLPTGLTKDGYDFGGWFTDSECTVAAVAGAALTGNTDLYAKWTERGSGCEDTPHAWDVIATSAKSYKVRISKVTEEVAIPVADATASNLTAYAGSVSTNDNVTVQIADGGSSKYGYKFDGSNTYLKLVFSTPLVLNDTLVVSMTNASHNISFTTTAVRSTTLSTSGGKLIIPAALAGQSTIYLWRGSGSTMYLRSFAVKHECEAIPSCTTPTLPTATLSNQTVCEGSDIAAWDATPTNASTISGKGESVSYSWKKKGNDTELANTATFDLGSSAAESQAGTYVVTVTVSKAGYTSASASKEVDLTVTEGEEVTGITADKATVYPGNSVTLTATANTPATWQWYTCNNAEGDGAAIISGATNASYTIASAGAAGTYYYKAVATGSCGTAERVYTLTVTAASECQNYYWFIYADDATANGVINNRDGFFSNTTTGTGNTGTYTMTVDGTEMTGTKRLSTAAYAPKFTVPAGATATLYIYGKAASADAGKHLVLKRTSDDEEVEVTSNTTVQGYTKENIEAGEWTLSCGSSNWCYSFFAVKVCSTSSCTDATPTIAAVNNTVCSGTKMRIDATGYEAGATFKWQKLNTSTSSWDDVAGETKDSLVIASVTASNAGSYRFIATKGCSRTSNTVTITVPSAPVFGAVPASVTVMQTIALSINTVEATDAVKYRWYKSADATWDAGDTEIGTNKELIKAYDSEAIGSPSYYIFCRAQNACGITTSSAIAVNVTAYVEEDCATRGNESDAAFSFENSGAGQGSYESTACWTMNSNSKILVYYPPTGKYFKTAKVTIASSSENKASYNWSTNGGTTYTAVSLTVNSTLTEQTINLSSHGNVNAFQIGRNFDSKGSSSGTLYVSKICFEYTDACTATTVTPSESSKTYEMGGAWSKPTFTLAPVAVSGETLTYSSSNEDIASVDDDGTVTFNGEAGTVTITASYAGGAIALTEYCASSGSYTINVSCPGGAPKVVPDGTVSISGCNSSITLNAKKQDGTAFADGTYQWFRNGEEIDGATSSSYIATQAGTYTVERTNASDCTTPSTNSAIVTSETTEPEVERLVPFQYYHVDSIYRETSIMRFRHLFAVKNSGKLDGKSFKMYVSRNGGEATDVTSSNALVVWPNGDGHVDTVMVDLNKLSGKYSENDELVYTCKAIDCSGNVSEVYKNTITMNVIGATPTLALICSGSSKAEGTRKTGELTVGGDFLTGYNVADLCQQTGNTSFDANTEWGLYTDLKANYIVTPVNGYAVFNKLNYEPFDILLLTDYPKASKSDAAKDVLDDMAALCDYRPMLSFKTHMVAKSPSKWAAKGFTTSPVVTKADGRLNLNIVCYAHPMFASLKTGDDVYTDVGNTSAPLVYTMLSGAGYESSKGMQGFELAAAENFITIGLTHYNGAITKNSPLAGEVEWTPGSEDRMLVTVAERQANPEARFILFSLNCGAQSKLTDKGEQVILACLNYLLGTAEGTIEPADCSFTFDNGENNEHNDAWYASNCPECHGTKGDGKWNTAANWGPDYRLLPGEFTSVRIKKPVEVDSTHAHVMEVRLIEEGRIDIPAGKGLDVKSTIRRMDGSEIYPTEENDIHIGSASTGNGTLIFNNDEGDTKARVDMYSTAKADMVNMSAATSTWQYIGTPHSDVANARYNYYNSWLYQYSGSGWEVIPNGGPLVPFRGYCVTHPDAPVVFGMEGTLVATTAQSIVIPAGYTVIANSWTAPIDINAITDDDMEGISDKSIYFFNTGTDAEGEHGTGTEAGTYRTTPIHSASYTGDWQIPSMQGFYVSTETAGTLHLEYDRHVRPAGDRTIVGNPMYAPRRAAAESDEPNVLKIFARGSRYQDKLVVLEREDFTRGYDSGWDGEAWGGGTLSPMVYVTGEGREDAVSAIPEFEGTVVAFKAGEDSEYRFEFTYSEDAEPLYLFDTENNTYTQIMTGNAYYFTTADKAPHSRFILTRQAPQVTTGCEYLNGSEGAKAKKLIIEDKMYIMLNGALYDATGKAVK